MRCQLYSRSFRSNRQKIFKNGEKEYECSQPQHSKDEDEIKDIPRRD